MRAPMERMSRQVQRFVDLSGLRKVAQGFEWVGRAATSVLRTLIEIVPVLGTITGAATIGGMVALVKSYSSWSQQLSSTADNLGLTTQQLQQFQDATRNAGGNADDMTESLKSLYKLEGDFATGQASTQAIQWLNRLGVNLKDANGHFRNMADLMPEIIEKIKGIKDPYDRAAAATALLGDKGNDLVNTFRRAHKSFADYFTDAQQYADLTEKQKNAFQSFAEAQGKLETSFSHLGASIGAVLADKFGPLLDHFADFVTKYQPQIVAAVENLANKFAAWLDGIKWSDVQAGLDKLCSALTWISNNLDTVKDAFEAVAAVIATKWAVGMVADIARVVTALAPLSAAILPIAAAIAAITAFKENQNLNDRMDQEAAKLGYKKQGGTGFFDRIPTYVGPNGEVLDYGQMQHRLGYGPEGMTPFGPTAPALQPGAPQPSPGPPTEPGFLERLWDRAMHGPAALHPPPTAPVGAVHPSSVEQAAPGDMSQPRGIRNMNPGNINFANQPGAKLEAGSDPRFAAFPTMDAGVAALAHQLQVNQDTHGIQTLRQQIERWAPSTENDTTGYIASVAKQTGLDPDAQLNTHDPDTVRKLVNAITKVETGRTIDQADVDKGVATAFGQPTPAAPGAPPVAVAQAGAPPAVVPPAAPVNGAVDVSITGKNLPPDSAVTAKGSGSVNVSPPRVEYQQLAGI